MKSAAEHYETHLARIYVWSAGGLAPALSAGRDEIRALSLDGSAAIDLGAGFGKHSIALAELGYQVESIDTSSALLATLEEHRRSLAIRTHVRDLLDFMSTTELSADVILCMGDTLTHLASAADVATLLSLIATRLTPGGVTVLSFRDYSDLPSTNPSFIPVRADDDRILTCILETGDTAVTVHDLLHERVDGQWQQRVSTYKKLRLSPAWVAETLASDGLASVTESSKGMVTIRASRAP